MPNKLKEFWNNIYKYIAFGNLEEIPLSQKQLETFDINNQTDEKSSEENLNSIDSMLNQLKHKKNVSQDKDKDNKDKEFTKSPGFDENISKDNEKDLIYN